MDDNINSFDLLIHAGLTKTEAISFNRVVNDNLQNDTINFYCEFDSENDIDID